MGKEKNVPVLRFPGFEGEWVEKRLGELLEFKNGINASKEQYGKGAKFINVLDILNNDYITHDKIIGSVDVDQDTVEKNVVGYGDILFQRSSETREEVGTANVYLDKVNTATFGGFVIRGKKVGEYDPVFMNKLLKTNAARDSITSKSGGSTRYNVGQETLSAVSLHFPSLPEQTKIADFLSTVDEKLQALKKKKALLEQYKKGLMQKLFSQALRFKDEDGKDFPDWEEKRLGEIAERVLTKNRTNAINFVLTNSATQGIVSQGDYFERDIANQNNLEGYYIVSVDDFVYNPRISVHAPVGPIKRNKLTIGVMSPLYSVFRFKVKHLSYFEFFFQTTIWHEYLENVANVGARHDRMNITTADFFSMPIPLPCDDERGKIATFLSAIDEKIQATQQQITQTETWKKGLLQQLFV